VLGFTLGSSTYATMLLRELMKSSVSTEEMRKLNTPGGVAADGEETAEEALKGEGGEAGEGAATEAGDAEP
jgi:hypothetical protein